VVAILVGECDCLTQFCLSETICSIRTKFWWISHWMVLFQKYVRRTALRPRWPPQLNLVLIVWKAEAPRSL
jgi:hypothetical protein